MKNSISYSRDTTAIKYELCSEKKRRFSVFFLRSPYLRGEKNKTTEALRAKRFTELLCAACFENMGCVYEQYFAAATVNLVTLLLQNQAKLKLKR